MLSHAGEPLRPSDVSHGRAKEKKEKKKEKHIHLSIHHAMAASLPQTNTSLPISQLNCLAISCAVTFIIRNVGCRLFSQKYSSTGIEQFG